MGYKSFDFVDQLFVHLFRIAFLLIFVQSFNAFAVSEIDYFDENTIRPSDVPPNAPRFEDFPAPTNFKGAPASPDVRSNPRSRLFRTVIREGAKSGPNFAGHYTVVVWGCGAACASWAIVDAETGRVFHPSNFHTTDNTNIDYALEAPDGQLVKFRLDSKLLVVVGGINENPALRGISYFVWEHNQLRRIRFVHRLYESQRQP